jgi:prepilin-type N-terminal cleavage/methylation domain-containing protein
MTYIRRKGFTLIELLVVISIITLLTSVVLASLNSARDKAKIGAGRHFSSSLYRAAADQAIGMWEFDECGGTTASDLSGNGRTITFVGTPTWPTNTPKLSGCAIGLNGSTQYGTISSTAFDRVGGNELAVSVWIKPSRLGGQYQGIVSNRLDGGTFNWILYLHTTDGSVQLHGAAQYKSNYIPPINTWTHIAAIVDANGNSTLYANGVVVQTLSGYSFSSLSGTLNIGSTWPGGEPFQGSIDEVRIFSKTLTAMDVKHIYAEGIAKHTLARNDVK